MVPGEDQITIASSDHRALDQLESLLRSLAQSEAGIRTDSNFAVYLLKNTGATEVQITLNQLFDQLPTTRGDFGNTVFVADDRLNALIVHGSRKDRVLVEELLQVLDTENRPDPLISYEPELIPVHHTQAGRVVTVLKSIYRSQRTRGGGRRPVKIPKGVSASVASVLQQINAAAAGPVLTLEVDEATNSVVMRAPPKLSQEIRQFVEKLDGQAAQSQNRRIRVIRLHESKSDRIQQVLESFIQAK